MLLELVYYEQLDTQNKISQSYVFLYVKIPSSGTCSTVTESNAIVVKQLQYVE
jgi:hypothetical protein